MRPYLRKVAAVGFLAFLVLWIVGVASGLTLEKPPTPPLPMSIVTDREYFQSNPSNSNQQYANNLRQIAGLA
jgi:hypothetical protein